MKTQRERECVCELEKERNAICDGGERWSSAIQKNVGRNFIGRRARKRNSNNRKVDVVGACWLRYEL